MWSLNSGKVTAPASLSAEAGRPLLLSCNVTTATGAIIRQVRWHNRHNKILLAYEQIVPVRVSHQDPNVQLTASHSDASYITIKKVRPDDEGCYRCIFDVFPTGRQEGKTCVSVTGQSGFQDAPNLLKTASYIITSPLIICSKMINQCSCLFLDFGS